MRKSSAIFIGFITLSLAAGASMSSKPLGSLLAEFITPSQFTVEYYFPPETQEGVVLKPNTHNYVSCSKDGTPSILQTEIAGNTDRIFWVREEPPQFSRRNMKVSGEAPTTLLERLTGGRWRFLTQKDQDQSGGTPDDEKIHFYSAGALALHSELESKSTLTTFNGGVLYYIKTEEDLEFVCPEGKLCGDGVCEDEEKALVCPENQPCKKSCEDDCGKAPAVQDFCLPCADTCQPWHLGQPPLDCGANAPGIRCAFVGDECVRTDIVAPPPPDPAVCVRCGNGCTDSPETVDCAAPTPDFTVECGVVLTICQRTNINECGDGQTEGAEECDDGANGDDTDGCNDSCVGCTESRTSLLTDLVSHWKLDEPQIVGEANYPRTISDAHGSYDLTEETDYRNSGISTMDGHIGLAMNFETSGNERLKSSDTALSIYDTQDTGFTVAFWVKDSFGGNGGLIGNDGEYEVSISGGSLEFTITHDNGDSFVQTPISPLATSYSLVTAWFDPSDSTMNIQSGTSQPETLIVSNIDWGVMMSNRFDGEFLLGGTERSGTSPDLLMDSVSFWKRVLTPAERTALYNSGDGLPYDQFASVEGTTSCNPSAPPPPPPPPPPAPQVLDILEPASAEGTIWANTNTLNSMYWESPVDQFDIHYSIDGGGAWIPGVQGKQLLPRAMTFQAHSSYEHDEYQMYVLFFKDAEECMNAEYGCPEIEVGFPQMVFYYGNEYQEEEDIYGGPHQAFRISGNTSRVRFRISDASDASVTDDSGDAYIFGNWPGQQSAPELTIIEPTSTVDWPSDTLNQLRWTAPENTGAFTSYADQFKIEYSFDEGQNWQPTNDNQTVYLNGNDEYQMYISHFKDFNECLNAPPVGGCANTVIGFPQLTFHYGLRSRTNPTIGSGPSYTILLAPGENSISFRITDIENPSLVDSSAVANLDLPEVPPPPPPPTAQCPLSWPCPDDAHCTNLAEGDRKAKLTKPNGEEICIRATDVCTSGVCVPEVVPCSGSYQYSGTLQTNDQLDACGISGTPPDPTVAAPLQCGECYTCGAGLTNICDVDECTGQCVFEDNLLFPGGACQPDIAQCGGSVLPAAGQCSDCSACGPGLNCTESKCLDAGPCEFTDGFFIDSCDPDPSQCGGAQANCATMDTNPPNISFIQSYKDFDISSEARFETFRLLSPNGEFLYIGRRYLDNAVYNKGTTLSPSQNVRNSVQKIRTADMSVVETLDLPSNYSRGDSYFTGTLNETGTRGYFMSMYNNEWRDGVPGTRLTSVNLDTMTVIQEKVYTKQNLEDMGYNGYFDGLTYSSYNHSLYTHNNYGFIDNKADILRIDPDTFAIVESIPLGHSNFQIQSPRMYYDASAKTIYLYGLYVGSFDNSSTAPRQHGILALNLEDNSQTHHILPTGIRSVTPMYLSKSGRYLAVQYYTGGNQDGAVVSGFMNLDTNTIDSSYKTSKYNSLFFDPASGRPILFTPTSASAFGSQSITQTALPSLEQEDRIPGTNGPFYGGVGVGANYIVDWKNRTVYTTLYTPNVYLGVVSLGEDSCQGITTQIPVLPSVELPAAGQCSDCSDCGGGINCTVDKCLDAGPCEFTNGTFTNGFFDSCDPNPAQCDAPPPSIVQKPVAKEPVCTDGPTVERTGVYAKISSNTYAEWVPERREAYFVGALSNEMANRLNIFSPDTNTLTEFTLPFRYDYSAPPALMWSPIQKKLYLFSGLTGQSTARARSTNSTDIHSFDPATKEIVRVAEMPQPQLNTAPVYVPSNGKMYLFGGMAWNGGSVGKNRGASNMNDVTVFNPADNSVELVEINENAVNGPRSPVAWDPSSQKILINKTVGWITYDPNNLLGSRQEVQRSTSRVLGNTYGDAFIRENEGIFEAVDIGYTGPRRKNIADGTSRGSGKGFVYEEDGTYVNQRSQHDVFYDAVTKRAYKVGGNGRDIYNISGQKNNELVTEAEIVKFCVDDRCCDNQPPPAPSLAAAKPKLVVQALLLM